VSERSLKMIFVVEEKIVRENEVFVSGGISKRLESL
jgi:hypothetical protein